jgi:hypothetical protein
MIYKDCPIDEKIKEIAAIGAILGDHYVDELYKYYQKHGTGYVTTVGSIANFSVDFFNEKLEHDWSDGELVWDDEVVEFGRRRLNLLYERGY